MLQDEHCGSWILLFYIAALLVMCQGEDPLPCKLHKESWIQAITATNGFLDLVINSTMYTIPFQDSHIDSVGRRLKLFGSEYIRKEESIHKIRWLRPVPEYMTDNKLKLVQMNILPRTNNFGVAEKGNYADVVLAPDGQSDGYLALYLSKLKSSSVWSFGDMPHKYCVLSDGKHGGYVFRLTPKGVLDQSVLATEPYIQEESDSSLIMPHLPFSPNNSEVTVNGTKMKLNPKITYLRVEEKTSTMTLRFVKVFSDQLPKPLSLRGPSKESKRYGFIFGGVVHYLDFLNYKVYLFEDPGGQACEKRYYTVSMDQYFACTQEEWDNKDSPDEPNTGGGRPSRQQIIVLAGIVLLVLLLLTIGSIACCFILKSKNRKRLGGKDSAVDDSVSSTSRREANRNAPPPSRVPRSQHHRKPASTSASYQSSVSNTRSKIAQQQSRTENAPSSVAQEATTAFISNTKTGQRSKRSRAN